MGGRPITALSIIGFPIETLPGEQMEAMMRGGIDKLNEAGCALIGGHSLNDEEIKFGFAVTGLIHPGRVVCRDRARPGDVLALTKPLGTGMLAFAAQIERVDAATFAEAQAGMATLNKDAAELMVELGAGAATDVTGYGLAGHLVEMAKNSGVDVEIRVGSLPLYAGVEQCLADGVMPGAMDRNPRARPALRSADLGRPAHLLSAEPRRRARRMGPRRAVDDMRCRRAGGRGDRRTAAHGGPARDRR